MKGFPPWPAMISEPRKWDLTPVKKKLLVYFYGTKEIAFCNYADLEAFTEEKKKSLLAKRHGKGADFVRAVKEIVEIFDSLKTENKNNNTSGSTKTNVQQNPENIVNNSSSLDTGGPEDCSDQVNGNKMEDHPAFSMDNSMISTPGPSAIKIGRCVVNSASAHGEPIEKLNLHNELKHSPLHASSWSKKRQKEAHQENSCTHGNNTLQCSLKTSPCSELKTTEDSDGLTDGANLPSVDLVSGDKQEDSAHHNCIADEPNTCSISAEKDVALMHSSEGICSQLGASECRSDEKKSSIVTEKVQSTCTSDLSQTGIRDKDLNLNETHDHPTSTTLTFKRKRRSASNHAKDPVTFGVTDMDSELQPKSNGNLVDSPNSSNEINKSDGDEHLPLVKRARVRMERSLLDSAAIDVPVDSHKRTELTKHADQCYTSGISVHGKDHSADELLPIIDASPEIDMSMPSEEDQIPCKNKEYQPKVLALDVEAALPPSKRLHRALEAMSANVSETSTKLPEMSMETILNGCMVASSPNNSADILVKSPKSTKAKSPEVSFTAQYFDTPAAQEHIGLPDALNKEAVSTVSPVLENDVSDGDGLPKGKVSEEAHMGRVSEEAHMDRDEVSQTASTDRGEACGKVQMDNVSNPDLDTPAAQQHIALSDMLNKEAVSIITPVSENDVSDALSKGKISEEAHMDIDKVSETASMDRDEASGKAQTGNGSNLDVFVHSKIDNNIDGRTHFCSLKSEKSVFVSHDQPSLAKAAENDIIESISGPSNGFDKSIDGSPEPKNIDATAEPTRQTNALISDTSGICNPEPCGETVLAEQMVNICDRARASSLVSKVSCFHSDASTKTVQMHSSSVIAPEELNHSLNLTDKSLSPDLMFMKEPVADGHARVFSRSNSFMDDCLDSKVFSKSLVNIPSTKEGSSGQCSPSNHMTRSASDKVYTQQNSDMMLFDNMQPEDFNKLPDSSEASSARRAFEAFVGTLTRTKESIGRATRLALECAKHAIAGEVMDIIIEHLERETNLHKRVDLFFLVDSIIRYCRNQKGGPGDVYPSLIQAVLPRIIYASAPPGNSAWENRRQCLKVLRLWLERKTLSEYIIRHHIKELEVLNEASFGSSHRSSGTERALNDPLRDDEAFLVDEYGSNAGFHLQNLICTKVLEDEEERSSEERSFEAVTPEREVTGANEQDASYKLHAVKHQLILDEVDGELEMEDAAPSTGTEASSKCEQDLTSTNCAGTGQHVNSVPPLPDDRPPSPPPLPSSPPPVQRPPCPVSQGAQVQGALSMPDDRIEQQRQEATYNAEGQHPYSVANNRGNMDGRVPSSQPPVSYNSGYVGHTNQMIPPQPPPPPPRPVPQFHPSGPHGNFCGTPVPHHVNNYHHPPSAPLPNNSYHLQPPPHPPVPNQFPYPPEPEQRAQPWNYNGSCPERYQYSGHDRGHHEFDRRNHFDDRGHPFNGGHTFDNGGYHFDDKWHHFHPDRGPHFSDRAMGGQMHHEAMEGGRFPPYFPPGPPFPDHFGGQPPLHCGRPSDPPPGQCSGWTMPDRRSKYPPASRHSMEPPVSHGGGWSHGRRDYSR